MARAMMVGTVTNKPSPEKIVPTCVSRLAIGSSALMWMPIGVLYWHPAAAEPMAVPSSPQVPALSLAQSNEGMM